MTTNQLCQTPLGKLLKHFEQNAYTAGGCEKDSVENDTIERCAYLLRRDYEVIELPNLYGEHCSQYPARILIPECEKARRPCLATDESIPTYPRHDVIYENGGDTSRLRTIIPQAKFARCRKRFPVPVILYKGKYICRSSTVSLNMESSGRRVLELASQKICDISDTIRNVCMNFVVGNETSDGEAAAENSTGEGTSSGSSAANSGPNSEVSSDENPDYDVLDISILNNDPVYKYDLELLESLDVGAIIDLMVEMKKVKFWMYVSSSEKADEMNRYADFEIISIPYPGCEFFRTYRDNNYDATGIVFNWEQNFVDATLRVPNNNITYELDTIWEFYQDWDLVQITRNYLQLILKYIRDYNKGILIHCISGWDRTPLFISLVRLSLWADGLIHKSLNAAEITYFTVAYDWYLFGHQLPDRRSRLEEILFFCFDFLKHIEADNCGLPEDPAAAWIVSRGCRSTDSLFLFPNNRDNDNLNVSPLALDHSGEQNTSPENLATNRSPQRRTSPLAVPGRRRQRTDSESEWEHVTDTGSIDTNNTSTTFLAFKASMDRAQIESTPSTRKERLRNVRAYFIKTYANVLDLTAAHNSGIRELLLNISSRIVDSFM